eukprot:CAMPEP_0171106366 /NCGR_PEP_ID=MMETSP0766_2-20121228/64604_1 /TAXON_ID=439317 /ORGANISM="Gambierdiscus australes, Strain CAWD 149" /LENGTH=427 /DNA_ID=CAMNT_0011567451 /DNA_START=68 /DNA_END=1351 /DNA_ORIENTATION=+
MACVPVALLLLAAAVATHATPELVGAHAAAALAADDECVASAVPCELSALQVRGQRLAVGHTGAGTVSSPKLESFHDDLQVNETSGEAEDEEGEEEQVDKVEVVPAWGKCGGIGWTGPTECVKGFACLEESVYYSMCAPAPKRTWYVHQDSPTLQEASKAPMLTFYVYRAQNDQVYPMESVNVASLGGVLWYLHNEVVSCNYGDCQYARRFGIDRIVRYVLRMRATTPLLQAGMNFGLRYAYDFAKCTGPWDCEKEYQKYGYFVGCNNLSSGFPFPNFPVFYTGAWYSLPGPCGEKDYRHKYPFCRKDQPGGHCQGEPSGTGDCTYSIEVAGEIRLDELEGIRNYQEFILAGGQEYNSTSDEGVDMSFWDGLNDTVANALRVEKADKLFQMKYPNMASDAQLPPPSCDFDEGRFFPFGRPKEEAAAP